ncbi:MAG: radical SAM family heme chaperone HemW [Rhodobacteraceae bacterium]|jgi:oxygen-independent coproporphyrinogen-3 oxidase|nr:radical SAM family heme chaperone HemW [Paracoccaceae bacterium]
MEDWQHAGFGLYLHWPFCQSKCPYCDFNSHVATRVDTTAWAQAFAAEIARVGALTPGRALRTIYFGGGTPSLMSPDLVDGILRKVRETWALSNDCEITLEANPGSVEAGRFAAFRQAGVNRISMGLQAMNDADLRRLGRVHTAAEAARALETAQGLFDRVSFDLIYARQHQTLADWRAELGQALQLAAGHLSLYQLTIEDGTVFGDRFAKGQLRGLPAEDLSVALWDITQDMCDAAGLPAYEVSNHARPGEESRHNLIYWQGGDYAGIGPGAHGRLTGGMGRSATIALRQPGDWLKAVLETGSGDAEVEVLAPADRAAEYMMMGLRVQDGIDRARFRSIGGIEPLAKLAELEGLGLITLSDQRVSATAKGRLLLNSVLQALLA